jgi:hypothetical protein
MTTKAWYKSKTILANAIALTASISATFGLDLGLTEDVQASIVVGIMGIVNIILRVITTEPVGSADVE